MDRTRENNRASSVRLAEALVRLGTSDSARQVLARTRAVCPHALTQDGPYLCLDLNALAGDVVAAPLEDVVILERGVLA